MMFEKKSDSEVSSSPLGGIISEDIAKSFRRACTKYFSNLARKVSTQI